MRNRKLTTTVLSCLLLVGAAFVGPATAQITPASNSAYGISLFVGTPSGEPFQVISGYDTGDVYTSIGDGVATLGEDAIVLNRDGIYRVQLEGVLAFDVDDTTADADAAALYALLLNDIPWVVCSTPGNVGTAYTAQDWRFSPDHEVTAACTVDFTFVVRAEGSDPPNTFPLVLPRGTRLQAALIPNDRALGDATLALVRFEISRIVP